MDKKNELEGDKDMNIPTIKKIDKSNNSRLTNEKKEILRKQMGGISSNIDLNKVREWWKHENN